MKCIKCGAEVKPNYKFCTKCGQPMSEEQSTTTKTAQIQNEVQSDSGEKLFGINLGRRDEKESKPIRQQNSGRTSEKKDDESPALVESATKDIDIVRGKAVWSIGPGQLARRVSESEFAQLDNVKGVVIQEGVTAVISVDGQMVGMLTGGYYEFATQEIKDKAKDKADKEEKEDKETEGFLQKAGNTARRVWRFLTGTKDKEKAEARKKRKERIKKNIQRITSKSTVNVTLVSTRVFELLFGSITNSNGSVEFAPMTIRAKVVDLEVGVSLQMQITNVNDFLINNLADRNSFAVADAQKLIQPTIENLFSRVLRNLDYQADGLPEELVNVIKNQITKTVNERVYGLEVVKVLDITDQSSDFERFRTVERELFASEHELGFLQRTGEFRNRLAEETNRQTIDEAKSEEDLRYALSQVNRDGLLHDDEMESFIQLLNSQKKLREAKTEEEEYEALQDLRKCRLVKDEDVTILEDMLERKALERGEVTELLRLRVLQNTEEARVKAENALSDLNLQHKFSQELSYARHTAEMTDLKHGQELTSARHTVEMTDLEIEARRKRDEYLREQSDRDYQKERERRTDDMSFSQQQTEFERQQRRAEKMDDVEILERKAAIARANMEKMQDHERQLEEMRKQTEELRIQTEATMTQEQIAATHIKEMAGLDAAAQAEMAKMMSSAKVKEAEMLREQQEREREMYEKMMQMMQQNQYGQQQTAQMTQEQMLQMMQTMMSGMSQMGTQRIGEVEKMKEEYKTQAIHQQERTDRTQDSSLNYTTRVTESRQESNPSITINQNTQPAQYVFCPNCGGKVLSSDVACSHCGESL